MGRCKRGGFEAKPTLESLPPFRFEAKPTLESLPPFRFEANPTLESLPPGSRLSPHWSRSPWGASRSLSFVWGKKPGKSHSKPKHISESKA